MFDFEITLSKTSKSLKEFTTSTKFVDAIIAQNNIKPMYTNMAEIFIIILLKICPFLF